MVPEQLQCCYAMAEVVFGVTQTKINHIPERIFVEKNYRMDFALELALKDMVYMKNLYEKFNVPAFLLDGGLSLLREAVKDGRGKNDTSEMAAVMYEYLGLDPGKTSIHAEKKP